MMLHNVLFFLAPPFIGAVIGYVTNALAIRMLFRPYHALYIGSLRLPFTPGIVPRRLEDLAVLLGKEVEARFFNADDLEILFQSDSFSRSVAESLTDYCLCRKTTLCYSMEMFEANPVYASAVQSVKDDLCRLAVDAIERFNFAPLIRSSAETLAEKRGSAGKSTLISMAPTLSEGIQRYFHQNGETVLRPVMEELLVNFGDRPVREIIESAFPDRDLLVSAFQSLWLRFMAQYVRPVVESIDVGGMITDKLRLMEPAAVEALILSVVRKEFRYIIWLGALLGAVIGAVNLLI